MQIKIFMMSKKRVENLILAWTSESVRKTFNLLDGDVEIFATLFHWSNQELIFLNIFLPHIS